MRSEERKRSGNSIGRAVFVGVSLVLQIGWLLLMVLELNNYSTAISLISSALASLAVLRLYSRDTNSAFKMPWIMLMMALPVMGLSLYLLVEVAATPRAVRKKLRQIRKERSGVIDQDEAVLAALEQQDRSAANQFRYVWQNVHSPVHADTKATYYPRAAAALEALKADLEKAEEYIFMEYFIVEDGEAFRQLREILARKAKQGVEVRLLYDDFGSIGYVNLKFARGLNDEGIQCRVFNPAVPVLKLFMNNRDHRKITVIDGKVGYTGGFNLADGYFDLEHPYGDWKDTGVRLEGGAVRNLTGTFLELWGSSDKTPENGCRYLERQHAVAGDGFVQPFGDDPLEAERAAENVYINMISQAEKYIYFMTPYLIITDELKHALGLAAKRGVDVRIITPGVPDKKTVYAMTRSYYAGLAGQGVRIYEYSPGFLHAKQCVCDGRLASIGTSNLDYRSLYLHFENNVLLYDCQAVRDMEKDFLETFPQCREVTERYRSGLSATLRTWQCILRLFAPMM